MSMDGAQQWYTNSTAVVYKQHSGEIMFISLIQGGRLQQCPSTQVNVNVHVAYRIAGIFREFSGFGAIRENFKL